MLDTLKTAGGIWLSTLRFTIRSPRLLLISYFVMFVLLYLSDALDDLSAGENPWIDDSVTSYVLLGFIGLIAVSALGLFQLYGMRYAMRFATGYVESWTPLTWCKRIFDLVVGSGIYLGLAYYLMPIFVQVFRQFKKTDSLASRLDDLDSVNQSSTAYLAYAAYGLLACFVIYILVRLSLWLPMAAFRRDDQWSIVLAWTHSRLKFALLFYTLVVFELVALGLMMVDEHSADIQTALFDVLSITNIPGWYLLNTEISKLVNLASILSIPALFCISFAIRTSLAANLLGIRKQGEKESFFSYKTRAAPKKFE